MFAGVAPPGDWPSRSGTTRLGSLAIYFGVPPPSHIYKKPPRRAPLEEQFTECGMEEDFPAASRPLKGEEEGSRSSSQDGVPEGSIEAGSSEGQKGLVDAARASEGAAASSSLGPSKGKMSAGAMMLGGEAASAAGDAETAMPGGGGDKKQSQYDDWDPLKKSGGIGPSTWCIKRIKRDLRTLFADPLPGIFVHVDESDITVVHALISGPFDTPYEGGFFYFLLRLPDEYPNVPPKVRLMTTGGGRTRFNPNLYQCGKVCLSILGTWEGPAWSPSQTLSTVLISIQSLMGPAPYHQEPGYESEMWPGDSKRYNECIQHETLRAAVCDMIESKVVVPPPLTHVMRMTFESLRGLYADVAKAHAHKDGQPLQDPFRANVGTFCYAKLMERITAIKPLEMLDEQ